MAIAILAWLHAVGAGVGHVADMLDFPIHCGLKQRIELGGFLCGLAGVGDFDGQRDGAGVAAEVREPELLHVGHVEDDGHNGSIPFWFGSGHKKTGGMPVVRAAAVDNPHAAEGGAGYGGGDSETLNDSASLQPSESVSDCRKS